MVQDKGSKKLKCMEIMRIYKEKIRRGITENNEKHNNQNEKTSETKWKNIKTVVTAVITEVVGYEERKRKSDFYDKDCQIKVEIRNKSQINMLNRRMRMYTKNYKNK
jgi:hypothetical protein